MGYISHLKNVSSNIQTQRSGLKKQGTADFSSDQLQDVWTSNETLGKVLDILKTFKVIPQCLIWDPADVYVVVNFLPQVNFIFIL